MLLLLNNAGDSISLDYKNRLFTISEPRLHTITLAHPHFMIALFRSERESFHDDLIQKYLVFAPEPRPFFINQIRAAPSPNYTLASMFLFIKLIHKTKRQYCFSPEALAYFDFEFDKYSQYIRDYSSADEFIR